MASMRKETDSLGIVEVAADKLWGAQTQRSLEHFSIGKDLIPREMITAYATLKKAAAIANHAGKRLDDLRYKLIVQACDEILAGQHHDMFPLHVWMTGSGTQFNMNVNEVISNRCCQLAGTPLGSKAPVHPNDDVNMAQSSNDSFPSAMNIAAAVNVKQRLIQQQRQRGLLGERIYRISCAAICYLGGWVADYVRGVLMPRSMVSWCRSQPRPADRFCFVRRWLRAARYFPANA